MEIVLFNLTSNGGFSMKYENNTMTDLMIRGYKFKLIISTELCIKLHGKAEKDITPYLPNITTHPHAWGVAGEIDGELSIVFPYGFDSSNPMHMAIAEHEAGHIICGHYSIISEIGCIRVTDEMDADAFVSNPILLLEFLKSMIVRILPNATKKIFEDRIRNIEFRIECLNKTY